MISQVLSRGLLAGLLVGLGCCGGSAEVDTPEDPEAIAAEGCDQDVTDVTDVTEAPDSEQDPSSDPAFDAAEPEPDSSDYALTSSTNKATLRPVSGSHNETQINSALAKGGVVHLSAGTYTISGTIKMVSNSTLEGDRGAIIKLVNNANWPKNKNMIEGLSVSNVRISGFAIDGNRANNTTSSGASTACGKYYYTMIYFKSSRNVEVDHMYLHHNWNDILKFSACDTVKFHDNTVRQPGHDVVYAIKSKNVSVYNNDIRIYCNSGVRPDGTTKIYIYKNQIARDSGAGGYAGIEIQGASTVWICSNNIHDTKGPAIANLAGSAAKITTSGCPTAPAASYPAAN